MIPLDRLLTLPRSLSRVRKLTCSEWVASGIAIPHVIADDDGEDSDADDDGICLDLTRIIAFNVHYFDEASGNLDSYVGA